MLGESMIFSKRLQKRSRHGRSPYGNRGTSKYQTTCKSPSEPPPDSSRVKFWLDGSLPTTITVDELANYRRRQIKRKDCDEVLRLEPGSFSQLKTEYEKHFKEYPLDVILQAYHGTLMDNWLLRQIRRKRRKSSETESADNHGKLGQVESEQHEQFVAYREANRAVLQRKNTLLHPEGDFYKEGSEIQNSYRGYDNVERMEPIKRRSNLKMEGKLETSTEQHDQFGPKTLSERAPLLRRGTNIRIPADDMELRTENHDQFVQHEHAERSEPLRHPETLRMEGDIEFNPEYDEQFGKYEDARRSTPLRQDSTLRTEGDMEMNPEYNEQFRDYNAERPFFPRPKTHLQTEGEFDPSTEKSEHFVKFETNRPYFPRPQTHLHSEGKIDLTTEKGEKFNEFDANRPYFPRPGTHLETEGNFDPTTENAENFVAFETNRPYFPRPKTHLHTEGKFDPTTEIGEHYKKFDANRPLFPRPNTHLHTEGEFESSTETGEHYQNLKPGRPYLPRPKTHLQPESSSFEATSEVKAEFKNHPRERAIAGKIPDRLRRPSGDYKGKMSENRENFKPHDTVKQGKNRPKTHLRLEGEFHADPEYKAKYQDRSLKEKDFASRKLYKEGPDHINFDGYNENSFQILSLESSGSGSAKKRPKTGNGTGNENDIRPSYRLEVCPADGGKNTNDKSFIVIPDKNNNIQPQSNWIGTEKRRNKNKWVPSWAGEDKK